MNAGILSIKHYTGLTWYSYTILSHLISVSQLIWSNVWLNGLVRACRPFVELFCWESEPCLHRSINKISRRRFVRVQVHLKRIYSRAHSCSYIIHSPLLSSSSSSSLLFTSFLLTPFCCCFASFASLASEYPNPIQCALAVWANVWASVCMCGHSPISLGMVRNASVVEKIVRTIKFYLLLLPFRISFVTLIIVIMWTYSHRSVRRGSTMLCVHEVLLFVHNVYVCFTDSMVFLFFVKFYYFFLVFFLLFPH